MRAFIKNDGIFIENFDLRPERPIFDLLVKEFKSNKNIPIKRKNIKAEDVDAERIGKEPIPHKEIHATSSADKIVSNPEHNVNPETKNIPKSDSPIYSIYCAKAEKEAVNAGRYAEKYREIYRKEFSETLEAF